VLAPAADALPAAVALACGSREWRARAARARPARVPAPAEPAVDDLSRDCS